jgi:hypothetical protein
LACIAFDFCRGRPTIAVSIDQREDPRRDCHAWSQAHLEDDAIRRQGDARCLKVFIQLM